MSIAELARRTGLTDRTIYRLEAGETRPLLDTVIALENALALKRGDLHFGADAVANDAPANRRAGDRRSGGRRRANREHGAPDRRKAARR
jgi:transcriptional regulator with XRE-family HTH domain